MLLEVSFYFFCVLICHYFNTFEMQRPPDNNQGISNFDDCFRLLYSKIIFVSIFEKDYMLRLSVSLKKIYKGAEEIV